MIHAPKQRIDFDAVKDKLRTAQQSLEQSTTVDEARLQQIFRQRAERLAIGQANAPSMADTKPVLVFTVGAETYGIELRCVVQVFPDSRITSVPGAPETLLGVANLDGEVRSVLGLRRLLGLPDAGNETNHYILLLRHDGRKVGLRVEQIEDVRPVAHDSVTAADDVSDQSARFVQGLTRDNLIVLRTDAFFQH